MLKVLHLSENNLNALPDAVCELTELTNLYLIGCGLTEITVRYVFLFYVTDDVSLGARTGIEPGSDPLIMPPEVKTGLSWVLSLLICSLRPSLSHQLYNQLLVHCTTRGQNNSLTKDQSLVHAISST